MGSIIAFVNMKGGVGKTTITVNLAATLAKFHQKRVLIIDLDTQINATLSLMSPLQFAKLKREQRTLRNLIKQAIDPQHQPHWAVTEIIQTNLCKIAGLDILPGDIELYEDFVLANIIYSRSQGNRDNFLACWQDLEDNLLKQIIRPLANLYDYIFLDFSPGDHLMTRSGILASDYYLIPAKPEPLSVVGIGILEGRIKQFRIGDRTKINLMGILFTALGRPSKMAVQIKDRLSQDFGESALFRTEIPMNVAVARAVDLYKPVILTEPQSAGAKGFLELAEEFLGRAQNLPQSSGTIAAFDEN